MVKYVPIYTKDIKKDQRRTSNDAYAMFLCVFFYIFFIKAYVFGTHFNCIEKSMQFKWVPKTFLYKQVDGKYTGCNLNCLTVRF